MSNKIFFFLHQHILSLFNSIAVYTYLVILQRYRGKEILTNYKYSKILLSAHYHWWNHIQYKFEWSHCINQNVQLIIWTTFRVNAKSTWVQHQILKLISVRKYLPIQIVIYTAFGVEVLFRKIACNYTKNWTEHKQYRN